MRRAVRPGGAVGFYIWDYSGVGVAFVRAFWNAATFLDPATADLSEAHCFPYCTPDGPSWSTEQAGLGPATSTALEIETDFSSFEDFWRPFTLGAGPAPGYRASLDPADRVRLSDHLEAELPRRPYGSIPLGARAWAIKTTRP